MGYTKLFNKILASSIWNEDDKTRLVWITMLAMQNERHIVEGSIGGLAHQARVSLEDCQRAIEKLLAPDPDDSSKVAEGRRIEPVSGGWIIINGEAYRKARTEDERKIYHAAYMQKWRKRQKSVNISVNNLESVNFRVNNCEPPLRNVIDVKTTEQNRTEQKRSSPPLTPPHGPERKMNKTAFEEIAKNPVYATLDLKSESWKYKEWSKAKERPETITGFLSWLNIALQKHENQTQNNPRSK